MCSYQINQDIYVIGKSLSSTVFENNIVLNFNSSIQVQIWHPRAFEYSELFRNLFRNDFTCDTV